MKASMPDLAAEVLANPEKYQGMTIPVNSGYITAADMEKELSQATNQNIRYAHASYSLRNVSCVANVHAPFF